MKNMANRLWSDEFYLAADPHVLSAGFHRAAAGWKNKPKNSIFDNLDIWFIASGAGAVKIDNKWVEFRGGDIITIKPGCDYQCERAEKNTPFEVYFVHVLPFGRRNHKFNSLLWSCMGEKFTVSNHFNIKALFVELLEEFSASRRGCQLRVKATMLRIMDIIFTVLRDQVESPLSAGYTKFLKAKGYIEQHFTNHLTLEQVAESSDLSASYLSALFNKHLGCSPIQYQITCRLQSARSFLAGGQSVSEVASLVGFNSLHYFSRIFKKRIGLSPAKFAEAYRR